ncbi:DUF2452 domain-containing protein [Flavicella sp.]|uniref:DUF2452 domain-containing protein n=1 Tax=Flavicella sp. TaxID=2957742 RepID=UPI00261E4664|nr:DUF2452 domain-containing protein [Flavicella sp.]MDG1803746.1 DUF2452 domain-containing protein [Flavicella sp.]
MKKSIPDNVVYNDETGKYDASYKEYGTNVSAPSISIPNTVSWKQNNLQTANAQLKAKYKELDEMLREFKQSFSDNQMLYNAKFNFEPIVGDNYHLYKNKKGESFLSILSPKECNFDFIGSYVLNSDKLWIKI